MRRELVSRTVKGVKVTVLILDIASGETQQETVYVGKQFKDDAKLLKHIESMYPLTELKPVHIISKEKVEKLMAQYESDFIAHAFELDPVTRKRIIEQESDSEQPQE